MSVKSRIRELRLEPFSARFAEYVISRKPEWEQFLEVGESEIVNPGVRFAKFHIPSENPRVADPLVLSVSEDHSISLRWFEMKASRLWDREFSNTADWNQGEENWPTGFPPEEATFEDAVTLANWIMSEEVVPYVHHYVEPGMGGYDYKTPDEIESEIELQRMEGGSATFRSWFGTHDRDLNY